ncbi:putative pectinesterase/pectinesterase inhibitor 59 [Silene latifolia]|uniref:putative pectinesterase/pectinesterase inhibitor 59 n=1 Tax=Silene latifolia TaxID=37657 RepID=UPI003D788E05
MPYYSSSNKFLFIISILIPFITCTFSETQFPEDPPILDDINQWCDTVPHPEPCKFFMTEQKLKPPKEKTEFRKMIVEVALQRAIHAQSHIWGWGIRCDDHKKRAAWADCVRLYDHTIIQLNYTLNGLTSNSSFTDFDAQTWLSAALTNLETCLGGSEDMNVTTFIWPHVSYNVSDLISNSLAVNEGLIQADNSTSDNSTTDGYPSWLSHHDRRLLLGGRSLAVKKAMFVVSRGPSARYKTIQSAIDAAARSNVRGRKVIHVKRGVYRENIYVGPYNNDITLIGDGIRKTVITGSRSVRSGYTTYNSATAGVDGLRFIARDISFRNTAGPENGQAVALRSGSDLSVFYKCAFYGYQDTLFVHSQRQFYKMCYIFGTIDIIFGNAAAVFQNCMIYVRKPIWGQANVITAQGRADPNQNTGIVIHSSRIMADKDLVPMGRSVVTYLGRPWQEYSRTIIMKTYIGPLVDSAGWMPWNGDRFLNTLYYAEYANFGPGSDVRRRVNWPGFHVIKSPNVATLYTVGHFIAGRTWLPTTGIPFSLGL